MRILLVGASMLLALTAQAQWSSSNADVDQDGCIGVGDVLEVLSLFGDCNPQWQSCGDTLQYDGYWYETVLIGDQCWFAENLRTTRYANGDSIPAGLTDGDWTTTDLGATAVYGEGSSTCNSNSPDFDACDEVQSLAQYGFLYNYYAVDDERGLCPSGWHVPTLVEWYSLEFYTATQGYDGAEGMALKSTSGWSNASGGANGTDNFGFSALPGGYREGSVDETYGGTFGSSGFNGNWWNSTLNGVDAPYVRAMLHQSPEIFLGNATTYNMGFSVRCLKDSN